MTIRILDIGAVDLPGTGYPPIEAFGVPVGGGLVGTYFLGDGPVVGTKNWAGGIAPNIIGSPDWRDGYAVLGVNTGYLSLGLVETPAMSIVAILRRADATKNVGYIGNWGVGTIGGLALFSQTGDADLQFVASRSGVPNATSRVDTDTIDTWTLAVAAVPAIGAGYVGNETRGVSVATVATARALGSAPELYLGALPAAGYSGAVEVAMALVYDRELTTSERAMIVPWARAYAARRGISV